MRSQGPQLHGWQEPKETAASLSACRWRLGVGWRHRATLDSAVLVSPKPLCSGPAPFAIPILLLPGTDSSLMPAPWKVLVPKGAAFRPAGFITDETEKVAAREGSCL